jgi:CRP-like cAMP-binding protein
MAEAADALGQAVLVAPADVALRQRLADLCAWLGRSADAVRHFQQVAGHYASHGHLLKAIAICRVILELDPAHAETQEVLAELYALQHETVPILRKLPPSMSAAVGKAPRRPPALGPEQAPVPAPGPVPEPAPSPPIDLQMRGLFLQAPPRSQAGLAVPPEASEPVQVDVEALGRAPLFSMLDRESFLSTLRRLRLRWFSRGERIVEEGQPGDCLYVVVQGSVVVVREPSGQPRQTLALLGEGSFFGEMALVSGAPRLATVLGADEGLLFALDRPAVAQLEALHPEVAVVLRGFFRDRLLANLLAVSPLFRTFSKAEKARLAGRFRLLHAEPGLPILVQGQPGRALYVVLRGRCAVSHSTPDGRGVEMAALREGDLFGEISLLFGSPCTATVWASEPCELLELRRKDVEELVLSHPAVKPLLERLAQSRLGETADLLRDQTEAAPSWWL